MLGGNLHLDVAYFDAGCRGSRRDEHRCGNQGGDAEGDRREEAEYILCAHQTRMHSGKRPSEVPVWLVVSRGESEVLKDTRPALP